MHLSQCKKAFWKLKEKNATALVFKSLLLTIQDNSDILKINTAGFFGFFFVNKKDTGLRIQINFNYIYKPGEIQTSCNDFNEEYSMKQEERFFAQSRH